MVRAAVCCGVVLGAVSGALPAVAQNIPSPSADAIGIARNCLRLGDAAFEQSLTDGLTEEDRVGLVEVFEVATYECLGLAMEICEGQEEPVDCLGELASWIRAHRGEIVIGLPDAIETDNAFRTRRYQNGLERAVAGADLSNCDSLSEQQRERYCAVVSEGVALEDAYGAWRMARREGAVDLVGHDPIDLERLQ